jgi:hypothetical protein
MAEPVRAEITITGDADWELDDYYEVTPIRNALAIADETQRKAALFEATAQLRDDARDRIQFHVEIYEPGSRGSRNVLWAGTYPDPDGTP